jgi:exodeoxyribonuclease VII small subunit
MAKQFNFTSAMKEVDKIIDQMESEEDLDKTIKQYKKALGLLDDCKKYLKNVENKVEIIKKEFE